MLFAALLAFAGVAKAQHWLQPTVSTETETYEYYIQNYRNAAYFVTTTSGLAGGEQQLGSANAFDDTKAKVTFKLVEGGKLWSTNTATPLILGYTTTGEAANSVQLFAGDSQEGYTWKIESANGGNTLSAGTSNNSWNMHGGAGANIGLYRKSDGGSNWVFVPANEAAVAKAAEAKAENAISTEYYYQIKNVEYSRMLAANETHATSISTNSTADLNQLWAFEQAANGAFYLLNAGQKKYLVASTEGNTAWTVAAEGTAFEVDILNFSNKNWTIHAVGQDGYGCAHDANWGTDAQVVRWEAAASASQWYLEKTNISATAKEISFTYSFKYNGVDKGTQECTGIIGEAYPNATGLPYGIKAAIPAGKVTEEVAGTTITVELSDDLPFVAATDYASIKNWYYIQMHSSGGSYSRYIQAMSDHIEWLDVNMDMNEADTYTWAFIGNPFDGFQLVNKSTGEAKVYSDGNSAPALSNENATSWTIMPSRTNPQAQYFCFQYPGSNNYMNAQSGKIAFWSDADQGSTMWVTERDLSGATELLTLIESANAMVDALRESTGVGSVTSESLAALVSEIEEAQAAADAKEGCIDAQVALQAAIDGLVTVQPEEGKFYTIASAMPESDGRSGQSIYVNENGGMNFSNEEGTSKLFQFVSAGEGKFYLYNVENGSYLNTAKGHNGGQAEAKAFATAGAKAVTITNMGRSNAVKIVPEGGAMLHAQAAGSSVVAWNNDENTGASAWTIAEVEFSPLTDLNHTLTVTGAGWATLVLGYNTTIPGNVKAYAVSSIAENKVVLAEVAEVLPAHTPVLIEATAAGEYTFNYTDTEATVASNLLAGSVFKTYVAPEVGTTNYVLSNNGGVVGLYKKTTENANGKIEFGANKAYLPVQTAAEGAPAMFAFGRGAEDDEESTGIESVELNGELVIYDLAGRRVEKMEKGIYIVNGKKVIK